MNPAFWGLVLLVSVIVIAGGVVALQKEKTEIKCKTFDGSLV